MRVKSDILHQIQVASVKRRLYLPHAIKQMARAERMISSVEVRGVIEYGRIIEDYPDDPRGHSCLMLGYGEEERPIHVVCSPKDEYLAIITAYLPDESEWMTDFQGRKQK